MHLINEKNYIQSIQCEEMGERKKASRVIDVETLKIEEWHTMDGGDPTIVKGDHHHQMGLLQAKAKQRLDVGQGAHIWVADAMVKGKESHGVVVMIKGKESHEGVSTTEKGKE